MVARVNDTGSRSGALFVQLCDAQGRPQEGLLERSAEDVAAVLPEGLLGWRMKKVWRWAALLPAMLPAALPHTAAFFSASSCDAAHLAVSWPAACAAAALPGPRAVCGRSGPVLSA